MLGHSVWDVFPEAVGTIFDVEFRRAMETGKSAVFESYYPPLDLWVAVRAYPSDDGLAVYFQDISDKRAAEQALLSSEQRYRSLFERSGDAVLIADDSGRYLDANPAACALLGVTRDEVIGRSLIDFVDSTDDVPDAEAGWAMFLAAGEMRGYVRIRRPDDTIRDAEFLATANVTPSRHLSVLRDDTDRLAAQAGLIEAVAALKLSEDRFRAALDSVALPAVILDTEGRLLFVNRHMLARTGWTTMSSSAPTSSAGSPRTTPDGDARGVRGGHGQHRRVPRPHREHLADEVRRPPSDRLDEQRHHRRQWPDRCGRGDRRGCHRATRGRPNPAGVPGQHDTEPGSIRPCPGAPRATRNPRRDRQDITDAVVELTGVDVAGLLTFEADGSARVLAVTSPDGHPFDVGQPSSRARLPI